MVYPPQQMAAFADNYLNLKLHGKEMISKVTKSVHKGLSFVFPVKTGEGKEEVRRDRWTTG
jgi:hypothetical protein